MWVYVANHLIDLSERSEHNAGEKDSLDSAGTRGKGPHTDECKFKEFIMGEEALKIPPTAPYCVRRPLRRGHFNISHHYSSQQVCLHLTAKCIYMIYFTMYFTYLWQIDGLKRVAYDYVVGLCI